MNKPQKHTTPVSLGELNQKINFEIKRLVREKEEGIVKHVSTRTILNGISTLVFKNKDGKIITLSYRHDVSGTLRFAREEQFTHASNGPSPAKKNVHSTRVGRASGDIH